MQVLQLSDLPSELLFIIFSYQLDPYRLFNQLLSFRHINKTFYELINNQDNFWQPLMANLRPKEYYQEGIDYFPTHSFIDRLLHFTHRTKFKNWDRNDACEVIYRTPEGRQLIYNDDDDNDEKTSNLFEKFSEWINAYPSAASSDSSSSDDDDCIILKALIQICLGREMISHIGASQVGVLIELFFEKLFEPAIRLVKSWESKPPEEIEWRDDLVFNTNLLQIIDKTIRGGNLFNEDITTCWNEMDGICSCIPRKYLLFVAEKFRGIRVLINQDSTLDPVVAVEVEGGLKLKMCMVTQIMSKLRGCGIMVEKIRFSNVGTKANYERTPHDDDMGNSIIPTIAKSFYLQHLAVFINSPTLLEWCLNVESYGIDTNLKDLSNNEELNVPLRAHVNTYIHDACGLTSLHYAVQQGNYEISNLLINKYLANPFMKSKIFHHDINLTACVLSQIIGSDQTDTTTTLERKRIFQILVDKYGESLVTVKCNEPPEKIEDADRDKDLHKLSLQNMDADVWYESGTDYWSSVQWRENEDEKKPMLEFTVINDQLFDDYSENECSDYSDNEYGLSYEWLKEEVKDQDKSLKRIRNPSKDYQFNQQMKKIRKPLEELESVKWNQHHVEFLQETDAYYREEPSSDWPHIKILKRTPGSIDSEQEEEEPSDDEMNVDDNSQVVHSEEKVEETNETKEPQVDLLNAESEDDKQSQSPTAVGPEFILRRKLTIPKKPMNNLINELKEGYKCDTYIMPNAKMMIQQASEDLISQSFALSQEIANFSGRDYVIGNDTLLAGQLLLSVTDLEIEKYRFYRTRIENIQRTREEFIENLNIDLKDVRTQLSIFIKDEALLTTVIESIDDQFESLYLSEEQDEDADYDGISDSSSDSTRYSEDSMISNVCIEDHFYGCELNYGCELAYSCTTANDFLKEKPEAIYLNNYSDYFTVREVEGDFSETRIIFLAERERVIGLIDNMEMVNYPPDEEYLD